MKRVTCALAAATLTAGLLSVSPPASAEDCPDISHPIGRVSASGADLVLEPVDVERVTVVVEGFAGCFEILGAPTVRVFTPERQFDIALVRGPDPYWGTANFVGGFDLDTADLQNGEAGEWGADVSIQGLPRAFAPLNVQRATRLSFDAGPEPLRRNHRLTFRGTLRAADWERGGYRGVKDQEVVIFALDGQTTPALEPLAVLQTKRHGHYRVREEVAGPNRFKAVFHGTFGLHQVTSRIDTVAARS